MYIEDRKRLFALSLSTKQEKEPTSTTLNPKSILVDKQISEPNSPEAKTFRERKPIQRGFSDLGSRIKKRVTLR